MQYKIREGCKLQNELSNVEHWEMRFIRTRTFQSGFSKWILVANDG